MKRTDYQSSIVALSRSKLYKYLAQGLLYPDEAFFDLLGKEAFVSELRVALDYLKKAGFKAEPCWLDDIEALLKKGLTLKDLQSEYIRIFGHTISKECPPCEIEYTPTHIFQQTQELGDIAGFYRAFSLEVSEQAKERHDHFSIEMEFMHVLALKEAYALEHHGREKSQICRDAQRTFMADHLGKWFNLFLELMEEKAPAGFYKCLALLTRNFLRLELIILGVNPDEIKELITISIDEVNQLPCEKIGFCPEGFEEETP